MSRVEGDRDAPATPGSDSERLAELDREHAARVAEAHAALAAAQDRSYWLDRWGVDLNALMRRRGAAELRTAIRGVRAVKRQLTRLRRGASRRLEEARGARTSAATEASASTPGRASVYDRSISPDPLRGSPVTDLLKERLTSSDSEAGAAAADAHAGRSLYYADLVTDGLAQVGIDLSAGVAVLDLRCSSGDVVRVLAAAYPESTWHGSDPIPGTIARPPLPFGDSELDAVFAISIWSHFAEPAARAWLAEMRRLIRPGGALLLTTHGLQSVVRDRGTGRRSEGQLAQISGALQRHGFWHGAELGEKDDHGATDPEWGTAFLTPEWLLFAVTPEWRVAMFAPGRVEDDQDLYVLQRN